MKALRIAEFTLSTLVVIVSAVIWILSVSSKNPLSWGSFEWARMFLVWTIAPIVMLVGSFSHAFFKQDRGFYTLFTGSLVMLIAIPCLFVLFGMAWGISDRIALLLLTPSILALFAVLTGVLVLYFEMRNRSTTDGTLDGLP